MAMEAARMKEQRMVQIIKESYTLSELEDGLGTSVEDLEDGLLSYIEEHYEEVHQLLREDLWFD